MPTRLAVQQLFAFVKTTADLGTCRHQSCRFPQVVQGTFQIMVRTWLPKCKSSAVAKLRFERICFVAGQLVCISQAQVSCLDNVAKVASFQEDLCQVAENWQQLSCNSKPLLICHVHLFVRSEVHRVNGAQVAVQGPAKVICPIPLVAQLAQAVRVMHPVLEVLGSAKAFFEQPVQQLPVFAIFLTEASQPVLLAHLTLLEELLL
mmetsp:Transcript_48577/g.113945  ORF Transcript_48577/g.113945 Transcript_48577/m.113945 type:complete len:205 (-) Transcript_48577:46-660(-)